MMNFKCAMRSRFPLLHLRWKDFAPGDVRMIKVSKPTAKPKAESKAKAKAAGVKAAPKQGQKRPHAAVAGDPDGASTEVDEGITLGCSKCRYQRRGCVQCRNPSYQPRGKGGGRGRGRDRGAPGRR